MKKQLSWKEQEERTLNWGIFWMVLINLTSLFSMILLRTDDVFFFGHFVISGVAAILLEAYKILR